MHLTCHGNIVAGAPVLALEPPAWALDPVTVAGLCAALGEDERKPALVFLSACRTADPFVGRCRPIQRALRALADGATAGVLIHGMGNLGKSSPAARIANRLPTHTVVVLFERYDPPAVVDALVAALPPPMELRSRPMDREPTRGDPLAVAALILAVPDAVTGLLDLADRVRLAERIDRLRDRLRAKAAPDDLVRLRVEGETDLDLIAADRDAVLNRIEKPVSGSSPTASDTHRADLT